MKQSVLKKMAPVKHAQHLFTKHCQTEVKGAAGMVDGFTGEVTSGFKLHYANEPSYRISMSTK